MHTGMCNAMYIDCTLKTRAASQQHPGGFSLPSHYTPPLLFIFLTSPPFLTPFVVPFCLSCSIICPFSLAKNTCCPVTITDHLWGKTAATTGQCLIHSRNTIQTTNTHKHMPRALDHNDVGGLAFATLSSHKKKCVCMLAVDKQVQWSCEAEWAVGGAGWGGC